VCVSVFLFTTVAKLSENNRFLLIGLCLICELITFLLYLSLWEEPNVANYSAKALSIYMIHHAQHIQSSMQLFSLLLLLLTTCFDIRVKKLHWGLDILCLKNIYKCSTVLRYNITWFRNNLIWSSYCGICSFVMTAFQEHICINVENKLYYLYLDLPSKILPFFLWNFISRVWGTCLRRHEYTSWQWSRPYNFIYFS
jgi:hypothetical protein